MTRYVLRPVLTALAVAALTIGCQRDDSGYADGQLGNGGFYFSCDDAVACSEYSGDASRFPKAVALGSTFAVRFVPKASSGLDIHFDESAPDRGVTVSPISDVCVSRGVKGLAAIKSGYATLASRDAAGQLVDYVVVRVAKPDNLVVYAADESRTNPTSISTLSLASGDRRVFRAFAQDHKENLAGSLQVEWTSSNPSVIDVVSTLEGKATVVALSSGTATLQATGGTFTQLIPVEVKQ